MISEQALPTARSGEPGVTGAVATLEFPEGLMGMHHLRHFAVVEPSPSGNPFRFLVCLDDANVGFGLADPSQLFANYEIDYNEEREVLGIREDDDAVLYVILTIGENPMRTTANLLAPILINKRLGLGRQLVLSESKYSTKHPIIAGR